MSTSTTQKISPCFVCGEKSIGYNFGVLTCMACKAFFRRNAVKLGTYEFICPKDGDCQIDHIYRRLCNCCRLAKCFRVGMRKELILTEAGKQARRERVEQKRKERENLSKSNKSDMTVAIREKQIVHQSDLYLTDSDRILLRNIFNAYESTCIAGKQFQFPEFPQQEHNSLVSFFDEYSNIHRILIKYIQFIPEFNNLTLDDRISLIRNQFGLVNNINEGIIHPGISEKLLISWKNIYTVDLTMKLIQSVQRIEQFGHDPLILKILLVVIAFSTGNLRNYYNISSNRMYTNGSFILSTQNIYIEVLWRYILFRSSTEVDAVRFFIKLIEYLMHLLNIHFAIDDYTTAFSDEVEQMQPLMKSMWPHIVNSNINANIV